MDHLDVVDGDAELVGHEHRPGRVVTLPMRRRPGADDRLAVRPDLDGAVLTLGDAVGDLDVARQADAELTVPAGGAALPLVGPQLVVAGHLEGEVEGSLVVAAVVVGPGRGRVGEGVGSDEVLPPDLCRIHADLGGVAVEDALEGRRRFRPPGAPVGNRRHGVGDDGVAVALGPGDVVDARRHRAGHERQHGTDGGVRPRVLHHVDPVGEDAPLPGAADLDVLHLPTPVAQAEHALRARLVPAHRAHELSSAPGGDDVLGVDARLRTKTPSHVRRDHVDTIRLHLERGGKGVADAVGGLGGGVEHEPPVALDEGGGCPRLERAGSNPLIDDPLAHDDLAAVEEGVVVPELQGEAVVRAELGVEQDGVR